MIISNGVSLTGFGDLDTLRLISLTAGAYYIFQVTVNIEITVAQRAKFF